MQHLNIYRASMIKGNVLGTVYVIGVSLGKSTIHNVSQNHANQLCHGLIKGKKISISLVKYFINCSI